MELKYYLSLFQRAADLLDKKVLREKKMEAMAGEILNSVFLKLYKKSWTSSPENPLTAETRIFFSIWVNKPILQEQKIFYNIHAFKLRKLPGHTIESRKFASAFRTHFQEEKQHWKNVRVDFGPLTLMEGWIPLDDKKAQEDILALARNFLAIDHLIDETLSAFKR